MGEEAFADLVGRVPGLKFRMWRTSFLHSSTRCFAIPSDGRASMRSSTVPWTEGCMAASLKKMDIAFPISADLGSLSSDVFGFRMPPIAWSFSRSLSVLIPYLNSGPWNSCHGRGSEWSSLNFATLGVSANAMAAERAAFSLAGYSPRAFDALSFFP